MVSNIQMDKLPGFRLKESQVYTVNSDGSNYSLEKIDLIKSDKSNVTNFLSKSISLTMLTFEK